MVTWSKICAGERELALVEGLGADVRPDLAKLFVHEADRNSSTVILRPSSSTPRGCRIHCQIWVREISQVAASSIRLKMGTQPEPRSQLSR